MLVEDKLFATLDTRTRRWQLPNWGPVLLSDTVGFIRDLPHRLIASFKATLEEARQADLLLHVADASNPAVCDQISAVYGVLQEIGIEEKDTLLVLNKIDRLRRRGTGTRLASLSQRDPDQRQDAVGARPVGRSRQRRAEPHVPRCRRGDRRGQRPADGLSGGTRRDSVAALRRQRVTLHCRIPEKYLGRIQGAGTVVRGTAAGPKPRVQAEEAAAIEDVA